MKAVTIHNVWIEAEGRRRSVRAVLPVDDNGKPIILVPTAVVRSGPAFTAAGYSDGLPPTTDSSGRRRQAKVLRKEDALEDAEKHPGRLIGYTADRIKKVSPRREFGFRRRR